MNVLFLGSVSDEKDLKNRSGASIPGNKMQMNIISYMNAHLGGEVTVVSVPSVAPFPQDRQIWYQRKDYHLENECRIIEVPFINIPLLKQLMQVIGVYWESRKFNRQNYTVLAFNLYPQIGNAVIRLKKRGYKTAAILADLPIDDNYSNENPIIRWMNYMTERNIQEESHLIVLNENAVKKYHPEATYIIMEGGCEVAVDTTVPKKTGERNIIFAGRLIDYNGIDRLLEAMKYVEDKSICLDIYGSGPLQEYVEAAAKKDARIRYYGSVDNATMVQLQRSAWLLINPRPVNDPISQVTFPSKMFEYLTSGTPVLTTKLSGFTAEYDNLMYYCPSDTAEGIAQGINAVAKMSSDETQERAVFAKEYVQAHKNWDIQAKRILRFLEEIE